MIHSDVKTVLVTGSSGFIGAGFVNYLRNQQIEVLEFDLPLFDITRKESFEPFLQYEISHVCNLAGKTFVPDSWKNPFEYYQINFLGTINVLDFCRKKGAHLVHLSSYMYGTPDYLPIDENHELKANNPYSHSKLLADNACVFYSDKFDLRVSVLRAFNVYGPNQNRNFLIPEIVSKVVNDRAKRVEVKDLRPRRDYIYIDDLLNAIQCSMSGSPGIYNVGSGYSVSVEELITKIQELAGTRKEITSLDESRQNEIYDLYADISKIRTGLLWTPEIDLETGLQLCIKSLNQK